MNRSQWIAGILILVAFTALILTDYNNIARHLTGTSTEIVRKWQTVQLSYCDSNNIKPCVVSFNRTDHGMLVNLIIPSDYPDFYLVINKGDQRLQYECQKVKDLPTSAYCEGKELPPGEHHRFTLASLPENYALAEGGFTIIGLMLATPEAETTPTPTLTLTQEPTETAFIFETVTPFNSPTALSLEILTPLPTTPTPTATQASYPNPSYPNP